MSVERREEGKMSPEDATFRILSGCGIENVRLTYQEKNWSSEISTEELGETLAKVRSEFKRNISTFAIIHMGIVGVADGNFVIPPSFTDSERNRYLIRELHLNMRDLKLQTTIISQHATSTRTETMDPLDLLSRMPETQQSHDRWNI